MNAPAFMFIHFATVLVMAIIGAAFIFGALFVGRFVRPRSPNPIKAETYECGEEAVGPAWISFNIRFYLIALVFVIFDVEAALMFPVAAVYRSWLGRGMGIVALIEILLFVAILFIGLIYVWAKRDLNWIKKIGREL